MDELAVAQQEIARLNELVESLEARLTLAETAPGLVDNLRRIVDEYGLAGVRHVIDALAVRTETPTIAPTPTFEPEYEPDFDLPAARAVE